MQVLRAKAEKRAREDGKQTVFWHKGKRVEHERFENFKKRKIANEGDVSPNASE